MLYDLTYNYTRAMLRHAMKYGKPYILSGIYQKHKDESERVTFTSVHPYVPKKQTKETCRLFDHVHVFRENLDAICPDWKEIMRDGERYCLVCYSRPYRDKNGVRRCSINLTQDICLPPVIGFDTLKESSEAYNKIVRSQCIDWEEFMAGKWIKENVPFLYSAAKCVQDNARHRKKVERAKAKESKKKKKRNSIWRVINMKVS